MHKILLALLLFVVFFFPQSEVFAEACKRICPTGLSLSPSTTGPNAGKCVSGRAPTQDPSITEASCPSGTVASSNAIDGSCQCVDSGTTGTSGPAGAPTAALAAEQCTPDHTGTFLKTVSDATNCPETTCFKVYMLAGVKEYDCYDSNLATCTNVQTCPSGFTLGKTLSTAGKCVNSVGDLKTAQNPIPGITSESCRKANTCPSTSATDGSCKCAPNAPASNCATLTSPTDTGTVRPATGTTTGPSISGSGQPCNLSNGQPIKLNPGDKAPTNSGIYTAIGCVPTEPRALVQGLLKFAVLASGGVAFLLMILGALGLITAEGNPEAIKHSQEQFYSAIIGLLVIIFAVLLMQVIGFDVLGLPGFGR